MTRRYAPILSKCVDTADQDHLAKALVNVSRVTNRCVFVCLLYLYCVCGLVVVVCH